MTAVICQTELDARKELLSLGDRALGKFGELVWRHVIKASGFGYFPIADFNGGGAPMIDSKDCKVILPDYDVMKDGRRAYVEVKAKTQSKVYRIKRQERHGVDFRNYEHYRQAEREAGCSCALAVLELQGEQFDEYTRSETVMWTGAMLLERLCELGPPDKGTSTQAHMCYWQRKSFRDIHGFDAKELIACSRGDVPVTLRTEIENVLFPWVQGDLF